MTFARTCSRALVARVGSTRARWRDQHAMLAARLSALEVQAVDKLVAQGYSRDRIQTQAFLNLRYQGTDSAIMTPLAPEARAPQPVKAAEVALFESSFVTSYKREFGFVLADRKILVDDLRVRAVGRNLAGLHAHTQGGVLATKAAAIPEETVSVYFEGGRQSTGVYALSALQSGCEITGPAILLDNISTILVEPGCSALITAGGDVKISVSAGEVAKVSAELDLVQLSIFSHRFMSIAEQMGRTLQRTAISTNIKERLDFSSAPCRTPCGTRSRSRHATCTRGTYSCPTIPAPAARTSLTSPSSRPSSQTARPCFSSPRVGTTPTLVVSRPAACRPTRKPSLRRA